MNKKLEKYKKAIESFRKFIKLKEDENDFLYESEEFYKNDIEQNELLLKMLHSVLNYIENSIPKKKVEDKIEETKLNKNHKYTAGTVVAIMNELQKLLEKK